MLRSFELKPRYCLAALLGSAILAFGLYNIHSLSGVTEGGVLGLTLLLKNWLDISPSVSGLILNSVCYILGWRSLGRSFVAYSIISSGGFSLVYKICELFPPLFPRIADMPLVASLVGALFVGVGSGICVRVGGAPSGDDALAMSLSRLAKVKIQWIYLASDLIVLLLSLSYIPLKRIVYSLLTVIISGQIIGLIQTIGIKKENKI
ncbi:MAG: YitT family protein [Clostridiales bacterium]|nr:YitT family protein [Clostridiales bacterium]